MRVLSGCGPFAHPETIAKALGFTVLYRSDLPEAWEGLSLPGHRTIVVREVGYPPREASSIGHELAEVHIPNTLPVWHEEFCRAFSARLILPRGPFLAAARRVGYDLAALRRRWKWASWEMIGHRIAEAVPGIRFLAWAGDDPKGCQEPTEEERRAVQRALRPSVGHWDEISNGLVVRAWHLSAKGELARAVSLTVPVAMAARARLAGR